MSSAALKAFIQRKVVKRISLVANVVLESVLGIRQLLTHAGACVAAGSDEMKRTFTAPNERGLRSWFRGAANHKAYTLVMV